jgi:hypothetical protein
MFNGELKMPWGCKMILHGEMELRKYLDDCVTDT